MFVDAHAHLDRYGDLEEAALGQIQGNRILTICVAMDPASYQESCRLASRSSLIIPTFGIHPWNAPQYAGRLHEFSDLIDESPMLGEIGLDYHFVRDASQYGDQERVFEFFLAASRRQEKIVNIHSRGAEDQVLKCLKRNGIRRAIMHWYSGPMRVFEALLDQGGYFTVGVEVLISEKIQRLARRIPEERLLTETDNPGGLQWLEGTPGMPWIIEDVTARLAEIRGSTPEDIQRVVRSNLLSLMHGDPHLAPMLTRIFG